MNELAGLLGGSGGGGGGLADPSSSTAQASPFDNINSGIFFGSEIGGVSEAPVSASATTPNSRAQQNLLPLASGATLPAAASTGISSTTLLLGLGVAVIGALFLLFRK